MFSSTGQDGLAKLQEHEEILASLYALFSAKLPEMRAFWDKLVQEEKAHKEALKSLGEHLASGAVHLDNRKFNVVAVQTSIDYIKRQIARMESEGITAVRALAVAHDLEQAIVEKEFFGFFASDSAAMKKLFQTLRDETATHRAQIEACLASERSAMNARRGDEGHSVKGHEKPPHGKA